MARLPRLTDPGRSPPGSRGPAFRTSREARAPPQTRARNNPDLTRAPPRLPPPPAGAPGQAPRRAPGRSRASRASPCPASRERAAMCVPPGTRASLSLRERPRRVARRGAAGAWHARQVGRSGTRPLNFLNLTTRLSWHTFGTPSPSALHVARPGERSTCRVLSDQATHRTRPFCHDGEGREQQHPALGREVSPHEDRGDRGQQRSGGAAGRDGHDREHAEPDLHRPSRHRQDHFHLMPRAHAARPRVQGGGARAERLGRPRHRRGAQQDQDVRAEESDVASRPAQDRVAGRGGLHDQRGAAGDAPHIQTLFQPPRASRSRAARRKDHRAIPVAVRRIALHASATKRCWKAAS